MIGAVHALAGAALGSLCQNRVQGLVAGVISHLVADALPHRDLEVPEEAVLLGATLGVIGATRGWGSREFAGAVGAGGSGSRGAGGVGSGASAPTSSTGSTSIGSAIGRGSMGSSA